MLTNLLSHAISSMSYDASFLGVDILNILGLVVLLYLKPLEHSTGAEKEKERKKEVRKKKGGRVDREGSE